MKRQFPSVSSQYGAPMGRASFGIAENQEPRSVELFRVNLDNGGYDDGGAYWGSGGDAVYCARSDNMQQFTRARCRAYAAVQLDLTDSELKRPLSRYDIPRAYSVAREFCGQPTARYVLRFWREFASHHAKRGDAIRAAVEHIEARRDKRVA